MEGAILLADAGADVLAMNKDGESAAGVAAKKGHAELSEWLQRIVRAPQGTPRLIPALQRLTWARLLHMRCNAAGQLSLIGDLMEMVSTHVPARVTWSFALRYTSETSELS